MKRNLDLIRELLMEVENQDDGRSTRFQARELSKQDWYHIDLLIQKGFLREVGVVRSGDRRMVHLTWEGHDYLDAVRDEGVWMSTKEAMAETGGSAALEIVKALAVGFAKKKLQQHTGVDI